MLDVMHYKCYYITQNTPFHLHLLMKCNLHPMNFAAYWSSNGHVWSCMVIKWSNMAMYGHVGKMSVFGYSDRRIKQGLYQYVVSMSKKNKMDCFRKRLSFDISHYDSI